MINRAVGALPALVVSLLISMPALAKVSHVEWPHSVQRVVVLRSAASPGPRRGVPVRSLSEAAAGGHRTVRQVFRSSPVADGALIRRAGLSASASASGRVRGALIDDGTLWREQGSQASWQQTGTASWYGGKQWQGQRTSSGARFDENALTAAHATLPLGTRVRVIRHDGNGSVIVTINDRPGTRTRIIDLSREAAKTLGILDAGVAMVTLQPL